MRTNTDLFLLLFKWIQFYVQSLMCHLTLSLVFSGPDWVSAGLKFSSCTYKDWYLKLLFFLWVRVRGSQCTQHTQHLSNVTQQYRIQFHSTVCMRLSWSHCLKDELIRIIHLSPLQRISVKWSQYCLLVCFRCRTTKTLIQFIKSLFSFKTHHVFNRICFVPWKRPKSQV